MKIWEHTRDELLNWQDVNPVAFGGLGLGSRWDQTDPPAFEKHALGTCAISNPRSSFGSLFILVTMEMSQLSPSENLDDSRVQMFARKYAQWTMGGSEPPPIVVLQSFNGYRIQDGHTRFLVNRRLEYSMITAWMSPCVVMACPTRDFHTYQTCRSARHIDYVRHALEYGYHVPEPVLNEYNIQEIEYVD